MPSINILDQSTINKIAAGEVIERPASVVKELVENAIDAGATAVTIEIKEGGTSFIRITDNGSGIAKEEVSTAFLRHATSKIKHVEDLFTIASLGFRGEALSSIASVAQVELVTKTKSAVEGIRYVIEGGIEKSKEEIGVPEGTTFIVKNLFYNTPVRRKFLKSNQTEAAYINDLVERLALSHPYISFKFINNNQNKLQTSGNGELKNILYNIYGRDITAQLIEVKKETQNIKIEGFIGKPAISRGNRNYENYYINGRYIKSAMITKAIEEGYKTYVMAHKYPYTALHFTIDPSFMDVNVHPTKMELRFSNGEEIYTTVLSMVRHALAGRNHIPTVELDKRKHTKEKGTKSPNPVMPEPFEKKRIELDRKMEKDMRIIQDAVAERQQEYIIGEVKSNSGIKNSMNHGVTHNNLNKADTSNEKAVFEKPNLLNDKQNDDFNIKNAIFRKKVPDTVDQQLEGIDNHETDIIQLENNHVPKYEQASLFVENPITETIKAQPKIIGQLFATYWIIELEDKMFIMDQHAAHEKVLYEKFVKEFETGTILSQQIAPPIIISLSMKEEEIINQYKDTFQKMGFKIEHFGGKEYKVCSVPYNFPQIAEKELLMQMIDELVEDSRYKNGVQDSKLDIVNTLSTHSIATRACKAAVKGNQRLSVHEVNDLINDLLLLDNPYTCPHGRPTIVSMTKYEIEKKFKRII